MEFFRRPAEQTVYSFTGYKIQGIYQKAGVDIVYTHKQNLQSALTDKNKTKHPKQSFLFWKLK